LDRLTIRMVALRAFQLVLGVFIISAGVYDIGSAKTNTLTWMLLVLGAINLIECITNI
jgi:hypothetical protein